MSIVKYEDLVIGQIYVTRGGTVTLPDGTLAGWGFERVKVIKKFNALSGVPKVLVLTPWGTEVDFSSDYPLEDTTEQYMRSEFKLTFGHSNKKFMTFAEAIKTGICVQQDIMPDSSSEVVSKNSKSSKETKVEKAAKAPKAPKASKGSETEIAEFTQKIIDYFSVKPRKMTEAAKDLGIQYQKIRYTIMNVKQHGFNLDRFNLSQSEIEGKTAFQLIKVEKK
jgi:hypothetical protein